MRPESLVAVGDPLSVMVMGSPDGDIIMCGATRGDDDFLASLDRHHYHGLLRGSPAGRVVRHHGTVRTVSVVAVGAPLNHHIRIVLRTRNQKNCHDIAVAPAME